LLNVNLAVPIVLNEAQFSEFVHKKVHSRPRCANHLGQRFLRYIGKQLFGLASGSISRKQQKRARQPFLAGVEQLVD
jgi:hypothetical protein